jgi:hypothetical protein
MDYVGLRPPPQQAANQIFRETEMTLKTLAAALSVGVALTLSPAAAQAVSKSDVLDGYVTLHVYDKLCAGLHKTHMKQALRLVTIAATAADLKVGLVLREFQYRVKEMTNRVAPRSGEWCDAITAVIEETLAEESRPTAKAENYPSSGAGNVLRWDADGKLVRP